MNRRRSWRKWYDPKFVVRFDGDQAGQGYTWLRNGEKMMQGDRTVFEYWHRRKVLQAAAVQRVGQGLP